MAKVFDCITPELQTFIEQQKIFFVATAPLTGQGHVNLSPKGLDCLRVLSEHHLAYRDLTGSGNETAAHLQENGRITLMWCAFEGKPMILRLYGQGEVVAVASSEGQALAPLFPAHPGLRQFIRMRVERVQTSCGMAVPLYEVRGDRQDLLNWATTKGPEGVQAYQQTKNRVSIDGLPTGLPS
jgi:hypothetical protein